MLICVICLFTQRLFRAGPILAFCCFRCARYCTYQVLQLAECALRLTGAASYDRDLNVYYIVAHELLAIAFNDMGCLPSASNLKR